jgi:long-subunit fatty acid transport protein
LLFEDGDYAEVSVSNSAPDVSGVVGGVLESGDMAPNYTSVRLGYKRAINDKLDLALIYDESIGADVNYAAGTGYPLAGLTAELNGFDVTGLLKYEVQPNISVYGGLRVQSLEATLNGLPVPSVPAIYGLSVDRTTEIGYVLGAAYEKPEIALRVALTYNSAIDHGFDAQDSFNGSPNPPSNFTTTIPQSVNLEFQTGVAADTLVFGSVRWQDWSEFDITPPSLGGASLVDYDSDYTTFTLGVGRRFNENWSGAVTLGYEGASGDIVGNLGPVDGFRSIGVGATYTQDNWKITGGVRYVELGDATTQTVGGDFSDNSAIGVGVRVAYSY